jgi:glycosyltransferase involved in cell wall biosynthesis
MKVLVISIHYPPEANSSALKMAELAKHLKEQGHQVTVVTAFPNYPDGVLHKGYSRSLWKRETIDGIPVIRTFLLVTTQRRRFGPRMLNYFSFMLTAIYGGLGAGRHDVVFASSPPLFTGVSGWAVSRMFGAPLVFDVNDLWPQAPIQLGVIKSPQAIRMARALEKFVYDKSERIFFYSNYMRKEVVQAGQPEEKTEIHPLWIDTDFFKPVSDEERARVRSQHGMGDRLVVMYAGNIGLPQGLETAIDCARLLEERGQDDVLFVFVGGGANRERVMERSRSLGLHNVLFIPSQPVSAMPAFLAASDALLLHLDKAPFRMGTIPGKLFVYMSAARPVLLALQGEAAELVKAAGCGVVVEPQDPEDMARGIDALRDPALRLRMGQAGRRTAVERYDRRVVLAKLERSLVDVAGKKATRPLTTRAS